MNDMLERLKRKLSHAEKRADDRCNPGRGVPILTILLSLSAYDEIFCSEEGLKSIELRFSKPRFAGYVCAVDRNPKKDIRIVER